MSHQQLSHDEALTALRRHRERGMLAQLVLWAVMLPACAWHLTAGWSTEPDRRTERIVFVALSLTFLVRAAYELWARRRLRGRTTRLVAGVAVAGRNDRSVRGWLRPPRLVDRDGVLCWQGWRACPGRWAEAGDIVWVTPGRRGRRCCVVLPGERPVVRHLDVASGAAVGAWPAPADLES